MSISDEDVAPTVRSAEGVELHMPIAGPTARMLAYALDSIVLWLGLFVLTLFVMLVVPALASWARHLVPEFRSSDFQRNPQQAMLPFLVVFLIVWYFGELLYFVFWEAVTAGSSPGKRMVGLRVVRLDGLRVDLRASCIRNLMRVADVLPTSYVVGLTSLLISPRGQRLGDLAAGTLVVRLDAPERALSPSLPPDLAPLALSREQLQKLGARERSLVRGALRRASSMDGERRERVLRTAADALAKGLKLEPALAEDADLFLRRLWLAMQQGRKR